MLKTGLEVFFSKNRPLLKKKRLGLIVNGSSINAKLIHTITLFKDNHYKVTSLFAPEHGMWGVHQDQIKEPHTTDPATRLKVYSLYGRSKRPTLSMLKDVDILVFDVQDIGTRYYTFIWTMVLAMEACEQHNMAMLVIDRPNPLNGITQEGPVLDPKFKSFVGLYPIPVRHGLTIGELALLLQHTSMPHLKLEVIPMKGWRRSMWFDATHLPWVMPSPNMPTLETATVYPGMCLFEGTNISEGRGTTRPFELFGAPWINPTTLGSAIDSSSLRGCALRETYFKPTFHKFMGKTCGGFQLHITDRNRFRSFRTAVAILKAIKKCYPKQFAWRKPPYEDENTLLPIDILAGTDKLRYAIENDVPLTTLEQQWKKEINYFKKLQGPYLLYR